jgi:hypothetical protein
MLLALLAPKDLFPEVSGSKQSQQHTGNKSLRANKANSILEINLWEQQSKQHTGNKSLGASKVNSILELSLWEQAKQTAYWK